MSLGDSPRDYKPQMGSHTGSWSAAIGAKIEPEKQFRMAAYFLPLPRIFEIFDRPSCFETTSDRQVALETTRKNILLLPIQELTRTRPF